MPPHRVFRHTWRDSIPHNLQERGTKCKDRLEEESNTSLRKTTGPSDVTVISLPTFTSLCISRPLIIQFVLFASIWLSFNSIQRILNQSNMPTYRPLNLVQPCFLLFLHTV